MSLNILVAEDSVAYAILYQQIFESRGHSVKLTFDGQECIDTYMLSKNKEQKPYDVVILDYSMPKKNGFEVARKIMATNPNQKIMIITSFDDAISAKLKQDGMIKNITVIEKPFNSSVLIKKIEQTETAKATHVIIN